MSAVSYLNVGPISTRPYNFTAQRSSPSGVRGFRRLTFAGDVDAYLADMLDELVINPAARRTIGGESGVLEFVEAESPGIPTVSGWYLLTSFDSTLSVDPIWPYARFSLQATLIGDQAAS
jgi:hypothetical protein